MDRTKSGIVDFGKDSAPHAIEAHDRRKQNSINYVDDLLWVPGLRCRKPVTINWISL